MKELARILIATAWIVSALAVVGAIMLASMDAESTTLLGVI